MRGGGIVFWGGRCIHDDHLCVYVVPLARSFGVNNGIAFTNFKSFLQLFTSLSIAKTSAILVFILGRS